MMDLTESSSHLGILSFDKTESSYPHVGSSSIFNNEGKLFPNNDEWGEENQEVAGLKMNSSSSFLVYDNLTGGMISGNVHGNISEAGDGEFPNYVRVTSTLLCGFILFIGIIGNILVPVVVWRNKDLRSSTNIFLINLSLADLLILLVCMPPVLIELHSKPEVWVLGAAMCKLVPFAELSVAHASVLTILAISLERYIAICRPLRANYTCTKQRAVMVCFGIWIIGCIATSPVLVITQYKGLTYLDRDIQYACLTQAQDFWSAFYFLSSITIFFFVPLFALVGLYWVISRNLMTDPSGAGRYCPDHPNMRSRRQVVIMLATVVFFFFICLLPFRIFTMYIILAPPAFVANMGQEVYYSILYFCRVMLYFNSAINPILYNVMSSKFREAFLKALGCTLGHQRRNRWLCRHLSRQSTFTTSSTLPTSSVKSSSLGHNHYHCSGFHGGRACFSNGDSVRIRELPSGSADKNGHFGRHPAAQRTASGPYYPSNHFGKKQRGSDANVIHTQLLQNKDKKMIRANSVV